APTPPIPSLARRDGLRTAPTGPVSMRRPAIVTNPTRQRGSDPRPVAPAPAIPSLARRVGLRTAPTSPVSRRQSPPVPTWPGRLGPGSPRRPDPPPSRRASSSRDASTDPPPRPPPSAPRKTNPAHAPPSAPRKTNPAHRSVAISHHETNSP